MLLEKRDDEFNRIKSILSDNKQVEKLSQKEISQYNKNYQDLEPLVHRLQTIKAYQKDILELEMFIDGILQTFLSVFYSTFLF